MSSKWCKYHSPAANRQIATNVFQGINKYHIPAANRHIKTNVLHGWTKKNIIINCYQSVQIVSLALSFQSRFFSFSSNKKVRCVSFVRCCNNPKFCLSVIFLALCMSSSNHCFQKGLATLIPSYKPVQAICCQTSCLRI